MSFDKSFYRQNNKEIRKEEKDYKALNEYKEVKFKRCKHKHARVINGVLRCKCGAAWSGPRINDLLNKFSGGK